MQEGQLALETPGYCQYWNYAQKKGYSGTAIFTKKEPLSVSYGLGIEGSLDASLLPVPISNNVPVRIRTI